MPQLFDIGPNYFSVSPLTVACLQVLSVEQPGEQDASKRVTHTESGGERGSNSARDIAAPVYSCKLDSGRESKLNLCGAGHTNTCRQVDQAATR